MPLQTPLGLFDDLPHEEGVAPYAGSALPGPLGAWTDNASADSVATSQSRPAEFRPAANVSASFTLGADSYRLLRVDAEWRQGLDEVRVPPQEALAIIERAAGHQEWNSEVIHLFETAASQLAGLHENGVFVLLQKQWFHGGGRSAAQTGPRSTPSAFRPPSPPEPPPPVEEPAIGAAQAVALKNAAASGAPFCEECARAAAARGGATAA